MTVIGMDVKQLGVGLLIEQEGECHLIDDDAPADDALRIVKRVQCAKFFDEG